MKITYRDLEDMILLSDGVTITNETLGYCWNVFPESNSISVYDSEKCTKFSSFRNGDEDSPDMENFLDGWCECMNHEDTCISLFY